LRRQRETSLLARITTQCIENERGETYEPPDENFITIGAEPFRCAEVLLLYNIYCLTAIAEREIPLNVQKKLRSISLDSSAELKSTTREKTCDLPDENIIFVVAYRFRCVEVLFQMVSR